MKDKATLFIVLTMFFYLSGFTVPGECATPNEKAHEAWANGDYDLAAGYYNPMAKAGEPHAQFNIGLLWYFGHGSTPQNYDQAFAWLDKAAKQSFPEAIHNIGVMYEYGQGIEKDLNTAISYYITSARLGLSQSSTALLRLNQSIPIPNSHEQQKLERLRRQNAEQKRLAHIRQQQKLELMQRQQTAARQAAEEEARAIAFVLGGGFGQPQKPTVNNYTYKPSSPSRVNSQSTGTTNYGYQGSSGTQYQYDLSRPIDQIRYEIDPSAQMRDYLSVNPRRVLDQNLDQYGGGIKR